MKTNLCIPEQFKPERPIEEGPFAFWISRVLKNSDLTREDLQPTPEDLALIGQLANQRDAVGDRLAVRIMEDSSVAKQLDQGLKLGIASIDDPAPELVEFLRHYEEIPDWAYLSDLRNFASHSKSENISIAKKIAPRFFLDGFAMAVGFFMGANYPGVGHSIVCTGSVTRGSNRMSQTMRYVDDMMNVKDFEVYGKAWRSSARVRIAHAFARRQIERTEKWDKNYYGEIISEFDNLIFLSGLTYLYVFAANFGIGERGKQALKIQIKAMQYLLGAPKEIITMSMKENLRLFVMVIAHLDDSPHTARQVVKAFHENKYFRPDDTLGGKMKREASFLVANLFSRVVWGNHMANEIGLEENFHGLPLLPLVRLLSEPPAAVQSISSPALKAFVKVIGVSSKFRPLSKRLPDQGGKKAPYSGSFGV